MTAPPATPPTNPTIPPGGGVPTVTITANQLRLLAEKADGTRDTPVFLVSDGKNLDVVEQGKVGDREVLLEVDTKSRGPGVIGDAKVRIFWKGHTYGGGALDDADALFVTQSAIEKFLLPYYMRLSSGAQVQALENKLFNDKTVAAAFHIPPSVTKKFPSFGRIIPVENSDESTSEVVDLLPPPGESQERRVGA